MAAKKKKAAKAKKAKPVKPAPMSAKAYMAALDDLGLTVAGKATAKALGLGVRHCQRIASGETKVPAPVALLLGMYLRHGLDDEAT